MDKPSRSPFASPGGLSGRFAGRLMLRTNKQGELFDLTDVGEGERILEVGYGPGGLVRLLRTSPAERICGVDPSPEMRDLASRPHRAEIATGRIDLRVGTADNTGFPDEEFDRVVTANTVAMWPDLEDGLRELHRVTRVGGRVLIAWHGGRHPSRIARRLTLSIDELARIERGLRDLFVDATRHELTSRTVFAATRQS